MAQEETRKKKSQGMGPHDPINLPASQNHYYKSKVVHERVHGEHHFRDVVKCKRHKPQPLSGLDLLQPKTCNVKLGVKNVGRCCNKACSYLPSAGILQRPL